MHRQYLCAPAETIVIVSFRACRVGRCLTARCDVNRRVIRGVSNRRKTLNIETDQLFHFVRRTEAGKQQARK